MEMGKENYYTKGGTGGMAYMVWCYIAISEFNDPIQHDTLLMPTLAKKCHIIITVLLLERNWSKEFTEWLELIQLWKIQTKKFWCYLQNHARDI